MAHILTYSDKMAHGHDEAPNDEKHHETAHPGETLAEKAKDVLHDIAGKTIELAHEVKEKITGHITDNDIARAASKVTELKSKLACERQQLADIQLATEVAENKLNLTEYEELKKTEQKMRAEERETEREISEAEGHYERLQIALRTQNHAKMSHE